MPKKTVLILIYLLFASNTASSEDVIKYSISPKAGYQFGYTQYKIFEDVILTDGQNNYETEYWSSVLKWPINSLSAGIELGLSSGDDFYIGFSATRSLTSQTGKTKDSDYYFNELIIYSESDTEMAMWNADLRAGMKFLEGGYPGAQYAFGSDLNLSMIAGMRYQRFSFTVSNVYQTNYYSGEIASVSGPVATYGVTYIIPYIGGGAASDTQEEIKYHIDGTLGLVLAYDKDDHLLRYKLSRSNSIGLSIDFDAGIEYPISNNLSLNMSGRYFLLKTSGKQTQEFYAGENEGLRFTNIDIELESSQISAGLGLTYRF